MDPPRVKQADLGDGHRHGGLTTADREELNRLRREDLTPGGEREITSGSIRSRFGTQIEARTAAFDCIEGGYSAHRRHSALDYLSPISYERRHERPLGPAAPENGFAGCSQSHDLGSA
jgi:transposase InsO family protein